MIFANVDSFSFGASADVASVSFGHQSDVVGMVLGPDGSYRSQYTGARALPAEHVGRYSLIVTTSAGGSRALYDSPLKLWLGLRNSDDAGTSFDLRTEVFRYPYEPAPVLRSIVHPNGTTLCGAAGSDEFTCQAAASGSHTILVRDSYGAGTGSYSVSLQRLNGPVGCTPLSFGTLPPVGSVEARCFTLPAASAGEELRVRLLSMSSTLDPTAEGLPPLGQMIATPVRLFKAFGGRDDRDLLGPDRMLIVDASATMRPIMIGDTLSRALASVLDRQRHEIGPAPERDGDRVVTQPEGGSRPISDPIDRMQSVADGVLPRKDVALLWLVLLAIAATLAHPWARGAGKGGRLPPLRYT